MSHDLKQAFTIIIGFAIGFFVAFSLMPSNLTLAVASGIVCGLLVGAFFAQVNYGDVFWHVGNSAVSEGGGKQSPPIAKSTSSSTQRIRYSSGNRPDDRANSRVDKPDRQTSSIGSFSTSRFHVMTTGSTARRKKNFQNEKTYWLSHLRSQNFIPGRQEQQGRRYQRRVKPREGLRIET